MVPVSKSTLSRWTQSVLLSVQAQDKLRKKFTNGQLRARQVIKEKTSQKNNAANDFARNIISEGSITIETAMIICSLIYQCEGSKACRAVEFTNSDPLLMATFLWLLRESFNVDEKKFRLLMHLHSYHTEETQKEFWSRITGIPKNQFNQSYIKLSNQKYKKDGYQGCVRLAYGDVEIARKLQYIAKSFMERYK